MSELEHFQFETLHVSNHTACRLAEKTRFFTYFGPGGAVPPPCVSPFSKLKRSMGSWHVSGLIFQPGLRLRILYFVEQLFQFHGLHQIAESAALHGVNSKLHISMP